MKDLRVLHLGTVAGDGEAILQQLRQDGIAAVFQRVETSEAFMEALRAFNPQLILSASALSDMDGLFALAIAQEVAPNVPFIFVTEPVADEIIVERIKKGAADCLFKNHLTLLGVSIHRSLHEARERTQLRLANETLQQQALLLDLANDAIMIFDQDQSVIYWNKGAERLYGWGKPAAIGKRVRELLKTKLPQSWGEIEKHLNREGHWHGELVHTRSDGAELAVAAHWTLQRDKNGYPKGILEIGRDITEQKRLGLQKTYQDKIENTSNFAGEIAHDFNNVLGVIQGYVSLIERKTYDAEKYSQRMESIHKALRRGIGLVRQLQIFARKIDESFSTVNVNLTIQHVVKELEETFPDNVHISTELDSVPPIAADAHHLHEALVRLCLHARQEMPKGGDLTITTKLVEGSLLRDRFLDALEEPYVRIAVTDTGRGMDLKAREHFVESYLLHHHETSGLGLGLVYRVVNGHSGFIDVQSKAGEGTTFRLYFPLQPSKAQALERQPEKQEDVPGGAESILIVEDEPLYLEMLRAVLEGKGYAVSAAKDGLEAIEVYRNQSPDLVISDLGLPAHSGWEAFFEMKQINPNIRFIMATGYLEPNLRSEMLKVGIADFVRKPYEITDILRKIRKALEVEKME